MTGGEILGTVGPRSRRMKHYFLGKSRSFRIQFFRYLFVGGAATVADLSVYTLLTKGFDIHYLLAAFGGYVFGFLVNYGLSIFWIFESRHERRKEFGMVFAITMGGLLWTELLLWLAVDGLSMDDLVARFCVIWIVLVWNFGLRKLFVFH